MAPSSLKMVFVECQHTASSHPKLLKQLVNLYKKSDFETFVEQFTNLLKFPLVHGEKQPGIERTLTFVAKFATADKNENAKASKDKEEIEGSDEEIDDDIDPFLVRLFQFLLDNHEANSKSVRFRVCQLINKILNNMGEKASIDDELYSVIYDTMLQRLLDKIPCVRLQAILALARLQDPRNKDCPVIKAYRFHLSMDPNPDVRRAVLNNIGITFQTLPDIIERIRDVRDSVRKQVYMVLSQRVHIRSLTIDQRVRLISEGLNDRSDAVKAAVEKMLIPAWLRLVDGNVLDLLTCLDVEASTKDAELALRSLFHDVPYADLLSKFKLLNNNKVIEKSELRPESAFYWRVFAEFLRSEGADETLECILPDLSYYCNYLKEFVMSPLPENKDPQEMAVKLMEKEFVVQQLVSITLYYDLADEVGRKSLDHFVRALLVHDSIGEAAIKNLVEVFGKLHSPVSRVNQLAEIISDVREPVQNQMATSELEKSMELFDNEIRENKRKLVEVKLKINDLKKQIEVCVEKFELEKAQTLKEHLQETEEEHDQLVKLIPSPTTPNAEAANTVPSNTQDENIEERDDPETLTRCLIIVCQMLKNTDVNIITPTLHSLHDNLVVPCLKSQDPTVRNHAIQALNLICLISQDYAKRHLLLFVQISQIDVEEIQITALQCIFDLMMLYGVSELYDSDEDLISLLGLDELSKKKINKKKKKKHSDDENTDEEEEENEEEKKSKIEEDGGPIIELLSEMLDSESPEIRTQVAEGFCKLLLASRLSSSKLLSNLILKWFNPAFEDDHMLRHMLGVFLPFYASHGGSNQESIVGAFLPTLHTLFEAPHRTPLADVDPDEVADFMLSITSPTIVSDKTKEINNLHDTLVFRLCTEIISYKGSDIRTLVKCLNLLQLSPKNYSMLRQVEVLADKLTKKRTDKSSQKGIEKFQMTIKNLLKDAPEKEEIKEEITATENEEKMDSGNTTSVNESTVLENTIDCTIVRKKRALYNTINSDFEIFSSDLESEIETTSKKSSKNIKKNKTSHSVSFKDVEESSEETEEVELVSSKPNEEKVQEGDEEEKEEGEEEEEETEKEQSEEESNITDSEKSPKSPKKRSPQSKKSSEKKHNSPQKDKSPVKSPKKDKSPVKLPQEDKSPSPVKSPKKDKSPVKLLQEDKSPSPVKSPKKVKSPVKTRKSVVEESPDKESSTNVSNDSSVDEILPTPTDKTPKKSLQRSSTRNSKAKRSVESSDDEPASPAKVSRSTRSSLANSASKQPARNSRSSKLLSSEKRQSNKISRSSSQSSLDSPVRPSPKKIIKLEGRKTRNNKIPNAPKNNDSTDESCQEISSTPSQEMRKSRKSKEVPSSLETLETSSTRSTRSSSSIISSSGRSTRSAQSATRRSARK